MCSDENVNVQYQPEQMVQGYGDAPAGVPENEEQKQYGSAESAPGYNGTPQPNPYQQQAPQQFGGYEQMVQPEPQGFMPPQPEPQMMYQQPQMPQMPPQGFQPMPPQGFMPQPEPQMMYQQPQMPQMPQMGQPMMPPQQPMYGYMPQMPPQMPPQDKGKSGGGCSHDHEAQAGDPFGGMFGMLEGMIDKNPNLSTLSKIAGIANNDFLKGVMLGAGITLLLTSDGVKDVMGGLFSGAMNMFNEDEENTEE